MKRRKFIKHTAHAAALPGILGSIGLSFGSTSVAKAAMQNAMDTGKALVIIFMDGGNDGLNTIVPYSELSAMHQVRPHVVLPEDRLIQLTGTDLGLHPAWSGMKELYDEGKFKIIQSVGYPNPNYSHFRSTDIWMSGSDADEYLNTGWAGRFLANEHPDYPDLYPTETYGDPLAIEMGYGASLLFQGSKSSMGMVISGPESFYDLLDISQPQAPDTQAGDQLGYVRLIQRQSQQYGEVVKKAAERVGNDHVEFPETGLAEQLKIVSKLIAGDLQTPIYMVRIGGFDTHDAQVESGDTTIGEHASLLKEMNDAIGAFMKDLAYHGTEDRVLGMTFSEFGRTINSNASNGTDHGSAAPMFFFGKAVAGGVLGENPEVPADADYSTDLPMQFDYRQLYSSALEQWLGIDASLSAQLFGRTFDTVPIIGEPQLVMGNPRTGQMDLKVFPNPLTDRATITFSSFGEYVEIRLLDLSGRVLEHIYGGKANVGTMRVQWSANQLPKGRYIVNVSSRYGAQTFHVIK
ncbi:MAG: DUF1501 domain-containing protein [Cyclobacteriaceae bacterium]